MKKFLILILILAASAKCFSLNNIQIQGLVANMANGIGISNQKIYITDNNYFYDTITTGTNGYYTLLITNVINNTNYIVSTRDCNNMIYSSIANSNNPMNTINFSICYNQVMNCQNSFSYSKQNNFTYNFSGSNISTYPTSYYWDFGDGFTAIGQNVSHTFTQPTNAFQNYSITLNTKTLYPSDTCYAQSSQYMMVTDTITMIKGRVTAGDSTIKNAWVCLYGINNPVGSCNLIDTVYVNSLGFYCFTNFLVDYPAYILKASFPNNSIASSYYIPTYYDTLYSWMNSPPVFPKMDTTCYNLQLINILQNQSIGSGNIAGSIAITSGKNPKSTLENIDILLLNLNNQVLRFQKASFQGFYNFSNLPIGNYKVFVELAGKLSFPENISLTNTIPNINDLNFVITDNEIILETDEEIRFKNAISDIFPNPANQQAYIDFTLKKAENIEIGIYNQIGQQLQKLNAFTESGNQRIILDIQNLTQGFYTVKISNGKENISKKLIKI